MANQKRNVDLVRININLPISTVNKVKEYSNKLGINLTTAYILLIDNGLDKKEEKRK